MKKVLISIPQPLDDKIQKFIDQWGFPSRSEFFRHAAQTYLSQNERQSEARKIGLRLPLHAF